jgi:hypothetical protein
MTNDYLLKLIAKFTLALLLLTIFTFSQHAQETKYNEIEWIELMPREDLAVLLDPPEFLAGIVDGSAEDNMDTLLAESEQDEKAKRFKEVLKSERVIDSFNGKNIRIPGFIVPLTSNEDREATEFFVVPYFGACLHLPPPPPNQILFAKWPEGIAVDDLSMPFWFEGQIQIETNSNELGTSAYGLTVANITPY